MNRHQTDPRVLKLLLPPFFEGSFIVKKGRGVETLVFGGLIDTVTVPDLQQTVIIACRELCERWIRCAADFPPAERWKIIQPPPEGLIFDYRWFYEQKAHSRLKLIATHHDRCWLCSHKDLVQRELFPVTLMKMFLDECLQKEESLFKRLRDRLLLLF